MHLPRPRSLNSLVLTGFALVALPLLFAIGWALYQIEGFAVRSESLLSDSTVAAQETSFLHDKVTELDRYSQLYQILEDAESIEFIEANLVDISKSVRKLRTAIGDPDIVALATSIEKLARINGATIRRETPGSEAAADAIENFGALRSDARGLQLAVTVHIDTASLLLRQEAARAKRTLTWQTVAIVPVTLGVVLIITIMVGRPIRQLDSAIAQLGQGGFAKKIDVKGPTDLQALGRQLEWLRGRLLELAQEKNRFLRHMSHELKTPLANIREGTDLLLDGSVGTLKEQQQEVTTILRSNGLRLQQLIENLLAFSSWQTKNETLLLTAFNLRDLVQAVARGQGLALKAQRINVHLAIEDIYVTADHEKMRTVIDNLLSNAVKFTPSGGDIYIKGRNARRSFVLEVADTGPGIPLEEQGQVFGAFFQGSNRHSGLVAGTGIGLSVVAECIDAHGGSIEIVNGEYVGAHFRMHVPQENVAMHERLVANG